MNYASIGVSPRRNFAWLTQAQREQFKESPSEAASRVLWVRLGIKAPGARHG